MLWPIYGNHDEEPEAAFGGTTAAYVAIPGPHGAEPLQVRTSRMGDGIDVGLNTTLSTMFGAQGVKAYFH